MATWPISIAVLNDNGDMAYGVAVQHVSAGDTITWTSNTGSFTLTFQDSVLTQGLQIQSTANAPYVANATVKSGAAIGRHYYSVAASYSGTIYTDPGCPEIVIK